MEIAFANQLVRTYIEGWKTSNREKILHTLDPACVIIESDGPIYRGTEMVGRWIDTWLENGNEVNRWDITSLYGTDEAYFCEWIFECTVAGNRGGFEGASLILLKDRKIVFLREYAMKEKCYEWSES